MAQYRKKSVVIEAIQYKGYMTEDIKNFVGDSLISESKWDNGPVGYFIKTLGTSYMLDKNDYIIKGVQGELYPSIQGEFYLCKPDIFETIYEKV